MLNFDMGTYRFSEEHRRNLSIAATGRLLSEETKRKISLAHKGRKRDTSGMKGKKHSPETILKMRIMRSRERNANWRGGRSYYPEIYNEKRRNILFGIEGNHTVQQWIELKKKFNFMCLCCKRREPDIRLEKDHIVPITKGGADYIENIQPLCRSCNSRKYTCVIDFSVSLNQQL